MAKNYFNRYVWLIDTINRAGHITFADISRQWERSAINDEGGPLAERTFHNHRIAIEDTFGIEIKCNRSLEYYIANSDDLEGDGIRQWLLESLSMNNLLNESSDMRDRILFEKIPSSQKWLPVIVNAMRDGKAIELTYKSFWRDDPKTFTAHPWCLKLFKQRWYVLARSEEYDNPRIYALDERMKAVAETKKELVVPKKFNAEEYFANYFGIIVGDDVKPTTVELKVVADQVKYFESLPLHHTQEPVETTPEFTVFQYQLVPTFDFKQEILSRGPSVKVLSPEWFQDEIRQDVADMASHYGLATIPFGSGEDELPYFSEEDELDI